jgi:hypothetical protein
MRKYIVLVAFVLILAFSALAAGIQFNILTYYTMNLQNQTSLQPANIFPIAYLNIPVMKGLNISIQDYLATSLATFSAFGVTLIQPTFWYANYYSGDWNIYLGKFRSNHVLTRESNYLWIMPWVGGFYDYVTGGEINYNPGNFAMGVRYDEPTSTFGGYVGYATKNASLYAYAAQDWSYARNNKLHLSANGQLNFNLGDVSMSAIGGAAYDLNTSNPTFGMPTLEGELNANYNQFSFQGLYANQPTSSSAYIHYDTTDPDRYGYPLQVANAILTYNLDKSNAIGALVDWNSNLSSPSFGIFYQHGYFSVTVGTGNMTGSIPGSNYIVLNYSTYVSLPLTSGPLF